MANGVTCFAIEAATASGPQGDILVMRALADGSPFAGILLPRDGASATYYVGWTSDEGRRCRAHNLPRRASRASSWVWEAT